MTHTLYPRFEKLILSVTDASAIKSQKLLQDLWSGYGGILRLQLESTLHSSVVIKLISPPEKASHPRGWNTNLSHSRKIKSYQVETAWYRHWSARCDDRCRIPKLLAYDQIDGQTLLILEDLDASDFPARNLPQIKSCLRWLAHFHATFMGEEPSELWENGTYWHLSTRPDEWQALEPGPLKDAASQIDKKLSQARYQTFVHGDAKLANFCFSPSGDRVAAVDFQYVGGGCGMKDVAYLIGSCLRESECETQEAELLDFYFQELYQSLLEEQSHLNPKSVIAEWRPLYPIAWTDFHRFLKGWSPDHWKINSYSERLTRESLANL